MIALRKLLFDKQIIMKFKRQIYLSHFLVGNLNNENSLINKNFIVNKSSIGTNVFTKTKNFCTVSSEYFEKVCDETIESLCEYFEELVESSSHLQSADVSYGSGVLTVKFGEPYGTYVINRQLPNRQIWLSSPSSGPKRYDFMPNENIWMYKHDNVTLHQLLQEEIQPIIKKDIDFTCCSHSSSSK